MSACRDAAIASTIAAMHTAALTANVAAASHDKVVDDKHRGTSPAHSVAASLANAAEWAEKCVASSPEAEDADVKRALTASLVEEAEDADMKKAIAASLAEATPAAAAAVEPAVAEPEPEQEPKPEPVVVEAPTPAPPEPDKLSQQADELIEEMEQDKKDEDVVSEDEGFAFVEPQDTQADPFPAPTFPAPSLVDALLDDLQEMGFANRELNKELLAKHEGDLKKTVRALVVSYRKADPATAKDPELVD